jgi:hypothetical protein
MEKPVQCVTLQEMRDELERMRPAWKAGLADLDGVLAEASSRRWAGGAS